MTGLLFLLLACPFYWLIFSGLTTGEIKAKGWGVSVRIYRRADSPVLFWTTFALYIICAVIATFCGLSLLIKRPG